MTIAFWVKLISGADKHQDTAGLMTTMRDWNSEGWKIDLFNWSGDKLIKFLVMDYQAHGKRFQKTVDTVTSLFGQWLHYVLIYQFVDPNTPSAQFQIYKNGQPNNGGYADSPSNTFTEYIVDKLSFGRQYITQNTQPYGNALFDEVAFFDVALSLELAEKLYQHYF